MSGGEFEYLQQRSEWYQAMDTIQQCIDDKRYNDKTLEKFKEGLEHIRKAKVYLQRIDWLLSDDDSEDTFYERLKEDLSKL